MREEVSVTTQKREKSETVSVSLPERDAAKLREKARREERSVSAVVRLALRRAAQMEQRAERADAG